MMNNKVKYLLIMSICLVAFLVVPGAFAFFQSEDAIANHFELDTVAVEVVEEFTPPIDWDGSVKTKKVQIQNNGSEATLIRVGITPRWQNADGSAFPGTTEFLKLTFGNLTTDWYKSADGYYYYRKLVQPGEMTAILIQDVAFDFQKIDDQSRPLYEAAEFVLDVDAQAVHAYQPAVDQVWPNLDAATKAILNPIIPIN